jgi:D-alanyl-D-alanine carboxypeptidase (penicillin-binding protein 5/6)
MLKGIALASGNDAAVALAEKVAGTEAQFVAMMNQRAQELGMNDTNFMNPNGLPVDNHYSSAHDIALMSRELLKHEEITKYTGMYQDYLRKDSAKPFWLVNTNKLVRFYDGADGLKTGYTSEAKYCLAATAKKEGLRVVVVVLGEPNTKTRNAEVSQMFDYAFAQYDNYKIFASGDEMGTAVVEKGTTREITLPAKHDYSVVVKKGTDQSKLWHELELSDLVAPIGVNQPIGKLRVFNGQEQIAEFTIDSPQSVTKASWWTLFKRSWGALMQ